MPFAVYVLLVWPMVEYVVLEPVFHRGSYWWWFKNQEPPLDSGPMWFVGVLLVLSLGYAAWVRMGGRKAEGSADLPPARAIVLLFGAIGLSTFVVRLVFPIGSEQILQAHLWQWPQCTAAFGLGVVGARRGWLRPVSDGLYRRSGLATLAVAVATLLAVVGAAALGLEEDVFYGGWGLFALVTAVMEGVLAVAAPVWALGFGQRHLNRSGPVRRAAARSSYAAFMAQGPVLVALALMLRPTGLPGDVKALLVAGLGIVGSFALAWLLVTRTPLRRIL